MLYNLAFSDFIYSYVIGERKIEDNIYVIANILPSYVWHTHDFDTVL